MPPWIANRARNGIAARLGMTFPHDQRVIATKEAIPLSDGLVCNGIRFVNEIASFVAMTRSVITRFAMTVQT